jgi:hypothetical protein
VSDQVIDNLDVAVLDGAHQGAGFLSLEKNLAGFEHALHIRQSTMGSVITECLQVKFDRHLQRKRQTLVLCSDGTADSADGDGVDIEARNCGSIHSKSKRCEPARVCFELALGEAVTAIQLGNCDLVRCWLNEIDGARLCGP